MVSRDSSGFFNIVVERDSDSSIKPKEIKINMYGDGTGDIFYDGIEMRFYDLESFFRCLRCLFVGDGIFSLASNDNLLD